jgi:tRNA(Ile)-lysidine synthase
MKRNAADRHTDLSERFGDSLTALGLSSSSKWAIAVSGGGDSLAMMHLAAGWALRTQATPPIVLTVDHGLQRDSSLEATRVTAWANTLGLEAIILPWEGPKPRTSIEEKARSARHLLMGEWCIRHNVDWLLLGHTSDDQVENFLLRLGRGSGVDGLSGMRPRMPLPSARFSRINLLRPLLDISRAELREYLTERGATWFEDPMNGDTKFARARIRNLIPALVEAGIPPARIVSASRHLARARLALDAEAQHFLTKHAKFNSTGAVIDGALLHDLPREVGLRAFSETLLRVSGKEYRPRFESLERLFDAISAVEFRRQTLSGCCVSRAPRARAVFGSATMLILPEEPRRAPNHTVAKLRRGADLSAPPITDDDPLP